MGSQRRMAESLMSHFLLSESEAYALVSKVEAVSIGDDLGDAAWGFAHEGDMTALDDLAALHQKLGDAIMELRAAASTLKPRKM